MQHLTPEQLSVLRDQLEQERARLRARLDSGPSVRQAEQVVEQQDGATIEDHRQQDIRLAKQAQSRLLLVDASLARIENRSYAVCEETGEPIPFARLRIEPTARYTVDAAESLEDGADDDGSGDDPGAY